MVEIISRDDFIKRTQEGLNHSSIAFPHGCSKAQARRNTADNDRRARYNMETRVKAQAEYDKLLEEGKVREPTSTEHLVFNAIGHPDNQSVQATRRMCVKRGIDWQNYPLPCPRCGSQMDKRDEHGEPYFVCPKCGWKTRRYL